MKQLKIIIISLLTISSLLLVAYFFTKNFIYKEAIKTLDSFYIEMKKFDQNAEFSFQNINIDIFKRIISIEKIQLKIPTNNLNINVTTLDFSGDEKKINFANFGQIEWIQKFNSEEYKIELSSGKFTDLDIIALYNFQKKMEWSNKEDVIESIKKISLKKLKLNNFKIYKKNVGKIYQFETVESNDLKNGKWGSFKINNIKLKENDITLELASADFTDLNVIALYDLQKEIKWSNQKNVIKFIKKISLKSVNLNNFKIYKKNKKNSFKFDTFESKDLKNGKWGLFKVNNIKLNGNGITIKLSSGDFTDLDVIALYDLQKEIKWSNQKNVIKFIKKISLKNVNLTDLDIKINSYDKEESFAIGTLSSKNIKDGKWGFFKVSNIKLKENDVKLELGRADFTDLDVIALYDFQKEIEWSNKEDVIESIKKISLKNVNFNNLDIKTNFHIKEEQSFTIQSLSSQNIKDGKLGLLEVGNIKFKDFKKNKFNIKNIFLKNLNFNQISQDYDPYTQKNLNETILIISEIYLTSRDRKDQNFEFSIKKINLNNIVDNSGNVITSSNFFIENLNIPISKTRNSSLYKSLNKNSFNAVKILNKMDQKSFKINLQIGTRLESLSGQVMVNPFIIEVKGFGKFDLNIKLSDLNSDVLRSLQNGNFKNYNKRNAVKEINKLGGKIVELTILYEDAIFANEIFKHISKNNIKSLADKWSKKILELPVNDKFLLQSLSKATYNFITEANKLSLYSKPKQPYPIENLLKSFKEGTLSKDMNIIIYGE